MVTSPKKDKTLETPITSPKKEETQENPTLRTENQKAKISAKKEKT